MTFDSRELDVNTLRQQLQETIFRGRRTPSACLNTNINVEGKDDNANRRIQWLPCITSLGRTFEDFCTNKEDIIWEHIELKLFDARDPSQCSLNLHLAKSRSTPPGTPLPTLCLLHGTGKSCDVEEVLNNKIRFVRQGFLVVVFDSRYHGCRRSVGYEGKEHYVEALIEAWKRNSMLDTRNNLYPFIYDTAADLSFVADYLLTRPDVSKQHMGITGISLGGMHAWFAAASDTRWTAVAPLIGVQSFQYALSEACYHARVGTIQELFDIAAGDMGEDIVTCDVVREVWHRICPGLLDRFDGGNSLALLSPRHVYIANGELDPRCPIEGIKKAVAFAQGIYERECGEPERMKARIYEGIGHEVTDEMWEDCVAFFKKVFKMSSDQEVDNGIAVCDIRKAVVENEIREGHTTQVNAS